MSSLSPPQHSTPKPSSDALTAALADWVEIVGSAHANGPDSPEARAASQATFSTEESRALAVVRPANVDELRACLRVANKHRVPVYPVSTGKNYGYGSRVPPRQAAVLELRRMDRILEYDEEMGYVTVEPGVTFRQLGQFLVDRGSDLHLELTSGPMDGSLIGNTLERGRSRGPGPTTSRPTGEFEVMLADGTLFRTGSGHFPHSRLGQLEPFPLGPDTRALFIESNLGVVTKMTIWLHRKARDFRTVRIEVDTQQQFEALIAPLRELMLRGVVKGRGVVFLNNYKRTRFQLYDRYPWELTGGVTPLPMELLRRHFTFTEWSGSLVLYSPDRVIGHQRAKIIKEALSPHASISVAGPKSRAVSRAILPVLHRLQDHHEHLPDALANALGTVVPRGYGKFLKGEIIEHDINLRAAYWRKREPMGPNPDLDRDRCGFLWIAPSVPLKPQDVTAAYTTIRSRMLEHGFEPFINTRVWDSRSALLVGALTYDRDEPGDDERARTCYLELLQELGARGYLPYRLPVFAMERLPAFHDGYGTLMRRLKEALDPHDILSPGRYDFRNNWTQHDDSAPHPEASGDA